MGDVPQVVWHTGNAVFGATFMGEPLRNQVARIEDLFSMGLSINDRMVLLRGLAWTNGLMGNDPDPIIDEYARIGGDAKSGLSAGLDLYRIDFAFGQGRFADAARLAEQTHNERNELGTLPWATVAAVMADDDYVTVLIPRKYADPRTPGKEYTTSWFDTWRFVNGKADEHWDPAQINPPAPARGR